MRRISLLLALLWQPAATAASVTIGTGSEQGIYHQIMGEFCRLAPQLNCQLQATSGSLENL